MLFHIYCTAAVIFFVISIILLQKNRTAGRAMLTVSTVAFIFPALFYMWVLSVFYFMYTVLAVIAVLLQYCWRLQFCSLYGDSLRKNRL